MKEKGMLVKKGSLSENGDIEFYEDESGVDEPVKQLP